jgi:hypothetical protein
MEKDKGEFAEVVRYGSGACLLWFFLNRSVLCSILRVYSI